MHLEGMKTYITQLWDSSESRAGIQVSSFGLSEGRSKWLLFLLWLEGGAQKGDLPCASDLNFFIGAKEGITPDVLPGFPEMGQREMWSSRS